MTTHPRLNRRRIAVVLAGLVGATVFGTAGSSAVADHKPADKIAVAGSGLETMRVTTTDGPVSEPVRLASGTMRTSSPTDLIFEVTAECALVTDVTTQNNQARAQSAPEIHNISS